MHGVEIAAADIELAVDAEKFLQALLQRLGTLQLGLVVLDVGGEVDAPAVRRALPVEQVGVFDRVGDVVALGVAVLGEVVGDLDVDGALGIGEALEFEAEVLARDAARAFAAHQIAAADRLRLACGVLHLRQHAVAVLREARELSRHPHIDQRMRLGHLERLLDDLDALALQDERESACRPSAAHGRTRRSARCPAGPSTGTWAR